MAYEDYTTYDEVEESGDYMTVTANKIAVAAIPQNLDSYVVKDAGVGHFGDFEHLLKVTITSFSDRLVNMFLWGLTNGSTSHPELKAGDDGIAAAMLYGSSGDPYWYMRDYTNDNSSQSADFTIADLPVTRYLTIKRDGTTLTCKAYSDAGRTALEASLSLTCATTTWRYVFGVLAHDEGVSTKFATWDAENLDLQEIIVPTESLVISRDFHV